MIKIDQSDDSLNIDFKLYQEDIKILHTYYPFMCTSPSFFVRSFYFVKKDFIILKQGDYYYEKGHIKIPITEEEYETIITMYNDCFGNMFKVAELLELLKTLITIES
jgi:hypothetical protein